MSRLTSKHICISMWMGRSQPWFIRHRTMQMAFRLRILRQVFTTSALCLLTHSTPIVMYVMEFGSWLRLRRINQMAKRTSIPIIIAGTLVVAGLLSTKLAFAHAFLQTAVPSPESVVAQSPEQAILSFSEGLDARGSTVTVIDASG